MDVGYFVLDNLKGEGGEIPPEFVSQAEEMIRQTLVQSNKGEYTEDEIAQMAKTFGSLAPGKVENSFLAYAADENGRIVGLGIANLYKAKGNRPEIQNLYVDREFQGRGIGKDLCALCEERMRDMGSNFVFLYSTKFEQTIAFYESRGFVKLPYHPDTIVEPGRVVPMVKRFPKP